MKNVTLNIFRSCREIFYWVWVRDWVRDWVWVGFRWRFNVNSYFLVRFGFRNGVSVKVNMGVYTMDVIVRVIWG